MLLCAALACAQAGCGGGRDRAGDPNLQGGPMPAPDARALAKEAAEKLRDASADLKGAFVESVVVMLAHRDANARAEAAQELGELRRITAAEPLLTALKDPEPAVRSMAVEMLGGLDAHKAFVPIAYLLQDPIDIDPDPRVRAAAAIALGRMSHYEHWDPLGRAAEDTHATVRVAVARALGMRRRYHGALARMLATDRDARVRATAAAALGAARTNRRDIMPRLVLATDDSSAMVRRMAVRALSSFTDNPSTRDVLWRRLHDTDNRVAEEAMKALGLDRVPTPPPQWDPNVPAPDIEWIQAVWLLDHELASIRAAGVRKLGANGDRRVLHQLRSMLKDSDPRVRQLAAEAIEKINQRHPAPTTERAWWDVPAGGDE